MDVLVWILIATAAQELCHTALESLRDPGHREYSAAFTGTGWYTSTFIIWRTGIDKMEN